MDKLRYILLFPVLLIVAMGFVMCSQKNVGTKIPPTDRLHETTNAIYYWRTTFRLSDSETEFLKEHEIGRIYLRMFDVTEDVDRVVPNATVTFGQEVPEGIEIVPSVFITVEAIGDTREDDIELLAQKIVERVKRICAWNHLKNRKEIQLDCDWTDGTRGKFFTLCKKVKELLPKGKLVSSTIRLHQLSEDAPPVDYGVLMVYNTDNFKNPHVTNSILNDTTVMEYLKEKKDFHLPLDIALPIYQWNLIYGKDGKFRRIGDWCREDDEVMKFECVPFPVLERTQEILYKYLNLQKGHFSTVLYHLDDKNIKNYSDDEIESLYNN